MNGWCEATTKHGGRTRRCTLAANHTGPHVAGGAIDLECHAWSDATAPAEGPMPWRLRIAFGFARDALRSGHASLQDIGERAGDLLAVADALVAAHRESEGGGGDV